MTGMVYEKFRTALKHFKHHALSDPSSPEINFKAIKELKNNQQELEKRLKQLEEKMDE